nr:hypothetical protein [uncultured Oscillibacter sp.]
MVNFILGDKTGLDRDKTIRCMKFFAGREQTCHVYEQLLWIVDLVEAQKVSVTVVTANKLRQFPHDLLAAVWVL